MEKLSLYNIEDITLNNEYFLHKNAFIKSDGSFYLADGYDCEQDAYQAIEKSAFNIAIQDLGADFEKQYDKYINDLYLKKIAHPTYDDKKTILVHFYGYVLFCRWRLYEKEKKVFYDNSLIPDPNAYGKKATKEQLETLSMLFSLNNDGTLRGKYSKGKYYEGEEQILNLVLNHKNNYGKWHH